MLAGAITGGLAFWVADLSWVRMQPNNPLHLEETGVQASTSAILTKHQEDAKAAAVSDEEDESAAEAAARSSSERPAKHPRLSKEQKQVSFF